MHEMSLAASIIDIVRQELDKQAPARLSLVRLRCGVLANVVPESLTMAFAVQTGGTPLEGARLELLHEPLVLSCGECKEEFTPEHPSTAAVLIAVCPHCGGEIGHRVLSGKELFIDHIEVE